MSPGRVAKWRTSAARAVESASRTRGRSPAESRSAQLRTISKFRSPDGSLPSGSAARVSRYEQREDLNLDGGPLATYYDELLVALDDLVITPEEIKRLKAMKHLLRIDMDDIYALHSRVFAGEIIAALDNGEVDEQERERLRSLHTCLSTLGWAPGD